MTEPTGKRNRRKHPRETRNSWQNQPGNRPGQNRGPRTEDPEKLRQHYHPDNHPKDAEGNNICGAWQRGKKIACPKPAGWMTDHQGWGRCSLHGGNTPTVRTSAAKWMGGEIIDRMTTSYGYGGPVDITPTEALLGEVKRCAGHVAWLSQVINLWGIVEFDEEGNPTPVRLSPEQQSLMDLYQEERKNLVKVSKTALDAGVNERRVRLAEQQADTIVKVLQSVFGQLNLSVEQQRQLPSIVPAVLRSIADPAPVHAQAERVDGS